MLFGQIVLVKFPYSDGSGEKLRPALVVARGLSAFDTVITCYIGTTPTEDSYAAKIEPKKENGLKSVSYVYFDKVSTFHIERIEGVIGAVSAAWLAEQQARFFSVFGF